jgi:hypothetical protein
MKILNMQFSPFSYYVFLLGYIFIFRTHQASYPMGTRGDFPGGQSSRGVKLTTHLLER